MEVKHILKYMSENDRNKQNLKIHNSQVGLRPIHLLALAHPSFLLKQDSTLAAPNAYHKILTPLSDLTADCLHLLMYFFYLIQHCAQQVHHTAVPLSPISSPLQKSCLQNIVDNQLSYVAAVRATLARANHNSRRATLYGSCVPIPGN